MVGDVIRWTFYSRSGFCMKMFTVPSKPSASEVMRSTDHPAPPPEIIRALHGPFFWFCTDGDGFQEPRVQMVRGYGFHIIAVGAWMVPEKLGLLWSGLRSLVKSAVWLRCGLRFQVKSAGRFRSGLYSTSFVPNCYISHAFYFRHAFTATNKLFYISTSTISSAAASCADCTSWRHWLRLSCCAAMTALYF